jgi:hypothetical protein
MGEKARSFMEGLEDHKKEILGSVDNAKKLSTVLADTKVTPELAEKIKQIVYRKIYTKKGFQSLTNYSDEFIKSGTSVAAYIRGSITNYGSGNYTYLVAGTKHLGNKSTSVFNKIETETRLMNMINEEFVEFMLLGILCHKKKSKEYVLKTRRLRKMD